MTGITEDSLLGGRLRFMQPETGYRAAIDPVLLAAAVPAKGTERVLDMGIGAGAAALCLAGRVDGVRISGLELQPQMADLARRNAATNGFEDRLTVHEGDLRDPGLLKDGGPLAGGYHHVMANPPYHPAAASNAPPDPSKATAHVEGEGAATLADWIDFSIGAARPKGSVTVIYRGDRLDEMLALMWGRLGGICVFPLWPGPQTEDGGKPAKRIIVRGRKGIGGSLRLLPGLILHESDGAYTAAADRILRQGEALDF